jgi:hypothetical protein
MKAIEAVEAERHLNRILLEKLLEGIDADIIRTEEKRANLMSFLDDEKTRLEQKKIDLADEFAERDAALIRLVDGDPPPPMNFVAIRDSAAKGENDARDAA